MSTHLKIILHMVCIVIGVLCVIYSFYQLSYPALAIIDTKGMITRIDNNVDADSDFSESLLSISFLTDKGEEIVFTSKRNYPRGSARYSDIRVGDVVPVIYYPWAPDEAQVGVVSQIFMIAMSFQIMASLISIIFGIVILKLSLPSLYNQMALAGIIIYSTEKELSVHATTDSAALERAIVTVDKPSSDQYKND